MAILSSPLFNAQQRLDLEDLNQLISGFKTDARLWVRQLFNTENMIIKGFQCQGSVNQTELQVDIISAGSTESATFILAGRRFDSTTGQIVESPSDFSWFTIESSQTNTSTGPATRLTAEIPTTFRPLRGTTRLYAYVRLLNSQGTPITKAFWDPSANSGSGAEFNQSVNTANDLAIALEVVNAPITNTADLLGRIPLATLTVDPGGLIRSVVDTRDLFFKKAEDFSFSTDAKLIVAGTASLGNAELTSYNNTVTNSLNFILGEEVLLADLLVDTKNATTPTVETGYDIRLRGKIVVDPSGTGDVSLQVDNLRDASSKALIAENADWAENVKPRSSIVIGSTSGACRMIETLTNRYDIDDKNITSFFKMFQSLQTEIAKIKGTDYWYDAPLGSIHDTLRQTNSVIIGEEANARYLWNPNNLSITTDPAKDFTLTVSDFSNISTSGTPATVAIAPVSGTTITVTASSTLNTGTNFQVETSNAVTAQNLGAAITRQNAKLRNLVSGAVVTISVTIDDADLINTVTSLDNVRITASAINEETGSDIAAIRIFGNKAKLFLERHDGSTTAGNGGAIPIPQGHVAYVKLPNLDDPNFDDTRNYAYNGVQGFTDSTAFINMDVYNNDAANVPQTSNSFVGRILIIPIERYIDDARHFWIAFHEDSGANNLFVRDIGQIGASELVPIGEGVTSQTLTYIGAANENDADPTYSDISSIAQPSGGGVFTEGTSKSNINTSIITQGENLTNAVNNLNTVAVSIKDSVIQDKDMRIVGGGVVDWQTTSATATGTLTFTPATPAFLSIPGLASNKNQLPNSIPFAADTSGSGSIADQVASVTIRRGGTATTVLTATVSPTASYTPSRDKVVIARRLGDDIYVGVNGSFRLSAGESAPLDGAISLFGFVGGQIPLQLRLAPNSAVPANIGASIADAETEFNINSTGGKQSLNLSITGEDGSARVLRFPGAVLDFTLGKIYNPGTTTNWLNRANAAEGTFFSPATIGDDEEVWYAISLEFDSTITAADVSNGIRTEDIGKILGRVVVSNGESAAIGSAVSAPFGGAVPIGQIRVFKTGSALQPVVADNIIQLGASGGGGGGGSGDASQTINDFINRLNLSTFNYFTPIVGSVFSTREQIDETNSSSDLVIGNNGVQLTGGQVLQSTQLLDEEYLGEDIDGIQLVELDAEWGVDNDGTQRIDPNAIWQIRKQTTESFVSFTEAIAATIAGFIDSSGTLRGTNLTNITPNGTNANIFFAENHNLETGQRITFTLGNVTIQDPSNTGSNGDGNTSYYVHRISSQAFSLYGTRALADAGGNRVTITSSAAPSGTIANLPAGVLPRIGTTNAVRGTHTFTSTVTASNLNIQIRVTGDTNANIRNQGDDALLLGFGMFYDQDGADVDSVPRTLDNVAEILRSNHLNNTETTTAGYGVNGRGVSLLNGAGTATEIALDSNNDIQIGTAGTFVTPITTNGATTGQILIADANGNFSPATGGGSITIPTPGDTVFGARIEGSTGAASIVSQTGIDGSNENFIQSIAGPNTLGTGIYNITWVPGFFTNPPTVTGNESGSGPTIIATNLPTTTGVQIRAFPRGTGLTNSDFSIIVSRQGADYTAARAITTTITF